MMRCEFEQLTGLYPSEQTYRAIEAAYAEMPESVNKALFCEMYRSNRDGLAQRIQSAVNQAEQDAEVQRIRQENKYAAFVESLQKQIEELQQENEMLHGWKPYEDPHNCSQREYDHLKGDCFTRILSDAEAKDFIHDELGFERSRIKIVRRVRTYEIDRMHCLRKTGETPRMPLYNSSDWNYIRFDVNGVMYEFYNGQLNLFFD